MKLYTYIAILGAALWLSSVRADSTSPVDQVPLYRNLGDHHYAISSTEAGVQDYFDQGLRLYYAFNHAEAIRSFREAQRRDEACAICWWGEALAWGPNINLPMDTEAARAAYAAIQEARARRDGVPAKERELIEALSVRYAADAPEDRAHLDQAYASAMAELAARYPGDQEIAVLYGESLMDLRPWDYWTEDGQPKSGIADALSRFETVIKANENHPGACHFFIHAVEKVYPERAVECADRLAKLMPGAGHIVHMPGHIYIRVGRYMDAVEANKHAVHADETYIRDQQPGAGMYTAGYYPHNYDFLAFAASMIGRSSDAIAAANKVAELVPVELMGEPGMGFLQHWSVRPLQLLVRFGRWQEILAAPSPAEGRLHAKAIWHYARGRALAATGDTQAARTELKELARIVADPRLDGLRMEFNASADILRIAEHVLAGWIAAMEGGYEDASKTLAEAVRLEDALLYGEPPEWTVPARHDLGAVLLMAGRPADAEQVLHESLRQFPGNGWSLYLLTKALRAQGKTEPSRVQAAEFEHVWAQADIEIATVFPR